MECTKIKNINKFQHLKNTYKVVNMFEILHVVYFGFKLKIYRSNNKNSAIVNHSLVCFHELFGLNCF